MSRFPHLSPEQSPGQPESIQPAGIWKVVLGSGALAVGLLFALGRDPADTPTQETPLPTPPAVRLHVPKTLDASQTPRVIVSVRQPSPSAATEAPPTPHEAQRSHIEWSAFRQLEGSALDPATWTALTASDHDLHVVPVPIPGLPEVYAERVLAMHRAHNPTALLCSPLSDGPTHVGPTSIAEWDSQHRYLALTLVDSQPLQLAYDLSGEIPLLIYADALIEPPRRSDGAPVSMEEIRTYFYTETSPHKQAQTRAETYLQLIREEDWAGIEALLDAHNTFPNPAIRERILSEQRELITEYAPDPAILALDPTAFRYASGRPTFLLTSSALAIEVTPTWTHIVRQ